MKGRIAIILLMLSLVIISTYFSRFLHKAFIFLIMKCFFQLYYGEFIPLKIISFAFFITFFNKTTFKDKTLMILVKGLCWNLKQKMGKKRNWIQFSEKEKMFCVVCRKHKKKTTKDAWLYCDLYTREWQLQDIWSVRPL